MLEIAYLDASALDLGKDESLAEVDELRPNLTEVVSRLALPIVPIEESLALLIVTLLEIPEAALPIMYALLLSISWLTY